MLSTLTLKVSKSKSFQVRECRKLKKSFLSFLQSSKRRFSIMQNFFLENIKRKTGKKGFTFSWESKLKLDMTSVELQHKALEWRTNVSR